MAKLLEIKEEEVEEWVITALTRGILRGQIDQVNSCVIILGLKSTELNKAYWESTAKKVSAWKGRFQQIQRVVELADK